MGTPHLGSAIAGKGNVMLAILKSVVSVGGFGANVENKLVKGLKSNSQELWEITTSFTHRAGKIKEIVTYVEQCVVPGMTDLVSSDPLSSSICLLLTFSARLLTSGQLY